MKRSTSNYVIVGTSALQPESSRYSNENENIIAFPAEREQGHEFFQINFESMSHARHASMWQRIKASIGKLLQKSTLLYDIVNGDLQGKSYGDIPRYKAIGAALLYTSIAYGVLFIAL